MKMIFSCKIYICYYGIIATDEPILRITRLIDRAQFHGRMRYKIITEVGFILLATGLRTLVQSRKFTMRVRVPRACICPVLNLIGLQRQRRERMKCAWKKSRN